MTELVWRIPHLVLHLRFRVREPLRLPPLFGSTFRGLLGAGLVRLEEAAANPAVRSELARLRRSLFEPAPRRPDAPFAGLARVPPPWLLRDVFAPHGLEAPAGGELALRLVLVGEATAAAVPVVDALALARHLHVGGTPAALELLAADPTTGPVPACPGARVRVVLDSPLRFRREGSEVGPGRFDAFGFGSALVRRLALLAAHHGDAPVELRPALDACARLRILQPDLRAWRGSRWSGRQRRRMPVTGILGTFVLDLADAPELAPLLALGTRLGAGRSVSLGCGQFRLEAADGARRRADRGGGRNDG